MNDNFCAAKLAKSVNNASSAFPSEYGWKLCSWWQIYASTIYQNLGAKWNPSTQVGARNTDIFRHFYSFVCGAG